MTTIDIIKPNFNATTESGLLSQIHTYLYQVSEQLNWALNTISSDIASSAVTIEKTGGASKSPEEVQASFNDIKSLIIKSADIVTAYYDEIVTLIDQNSLYAAHSDFGDFVEKTNLTLTSHNGKIEENINNLQSIYDENGNIKAELLVNGHIYSGIIEYAKSGESIVGIEIGQTTTTNGENTFNKFARFTADRLSFYEGDGTEVAYISDYELVITYAKIKYALLFGEVSGYKLDSSDGLAFIWEDSHPVYGGDS